MMKTTSVIQKEELISMLEVMNKQLEQLELSMAAKRPLFQFEWQQSQGKRIEECGKQLESLEMKISSIEEHQDVCQTPSLRFKLSY